MDWPKTLTGIKNLDLKILGKVAADTLPNCCLTNKYLYSLCQKPEFLRLKLLSIVDDSLIDFKLDTIPDEKYYYFIVEHVHEFWFLVVAFGSDKLISEMIKSYYKLGITVETNLEENISYWTSEDAKKAARYNIVSIIRNYKPEPLNWVDDIILSYSLAYDLLYEPSELDELENLDEMDRAFIKDKFNYTFDWMLAHGLKFNLNLIPEMIRENDDSYQKFETILKYNIPIPSGIFEDVVVIPLDDMKLLLAHGYHPSQLEIDKSVESLHWVSMSEYLLPLHKLYLEHGYSFSKDVLNKFVVTHFRMDAMIDFIKLYVRFGIYPDSLVPLELLTALHENKGLVYVNHLPQTKVLESFNTLLELYDKYHLKIDYQRLLDLATQYGYDVISQYINEKI